LLVFKAMQSSILLEMECCSVLLTVIDEVFPKTFFIGRGMLLTLDHQVNCVQSGCYLLTVIIMILIITSHVYIMVST